MHGWVNEKREYITSNYSIEIIGIEHFGVENCRDWILEEICKAKLTMDSNRYSTFYCGHTCL